MIRLTKEQRNEVYKYALMRIETGQSNFLCPAINMALFYSKFYDIKNDEIIEVMLEFGSFKPKNISNYHKWWPIDDKQSRIDCLNKCIELTNKKVKK